MPSSFKQRSDFTHPIREWKPIDFQAATLDSHSSLNTSPQANDRDGTFVELVEIVEEKITSPSNPAKETPSYRSEGVQLWQPQPLVEFTNEGVSSHDRLHRRVINEQAEARFHQASKEAEHIIAQAKREAERILVEAQEQANYIQRQAYADGQAAANAEAHGMLKAARAIVDEVQKWKENLFEEGELMMLRLVIEIAQTIFGDGLPLDPDTLGQAFTRAMSQAKSLGDLRIYLHPEDAAILSAHWDKLQGVTAGQKVELVPSDLIKRGGCYVEGQYGIVDARVETQFQLATEALLANLEKNRPR